MTEEFTFNKFKDKIELINSEINKTVSGEPKKLYDAARHLFKKQAGGKRIRPILLFLAHETVSGTEGVLKSAVSTELIHTFTLIHDDLMDNDRLRRGMASVHAAYGDTTAILAGDLLFAKAFEICDAKISDILAHAASEVCEGQQLDMSYEEKEVITEEEYMDMIMKKTGVLIEASTKAGAVLGCASDAEVFAMATYGRNIGIAFQIHDDILDLIGDEKKLGKPIGSDIYEGKKTLIVVKALEFLDRANRGELLKILNKKDNTSEEVKRALELINNCGAMDYCINKEKELIKIAKNEISIFKDSDAKQDLMDIADFMIKRET